MYLIVSKYLRDGPPPPRAVDPSHFASSRQKKKDDDSSETAKIRDDEKLQGKKGDIDVSDHLRVARNSDPFVVAGAIAKKVRRGETVAMLCIGGLSVSISVQVSDSLPLYAGTNYRKANPTRQHPSNQSARLPPSPPPPPPP